MNVTSYIVAFWVNTNYSISEIYNSTKCSKTYIGAYCDYCSLLHIGEYLFGESITLLPYGRLYSSSK